MSLLREALKKAGLVSLKDLERAGKSLQTMQWALDEMRKQIALEQGRTHAIFEMRHIDKPDFQHSTFPSNTDRGPVIQHVVAFKTSDLIYVPADEHIYNETAANLIRQRIHAAMMTQLEKRVADFCSRLFTGAFNHHGGGGANGGESLEQGRDRAAVGTGDVSGPAAQHPVEDGSQGDGAGEPKPSVLRGRKAPGAGTVSRPVAKRGPGSASRLKRR